MDAKEISVQGLVNGMKIHEIEENALKTHGTQSITGRFTVQNLEVLGNVTVDGLINSINLTSFDLSAVHLMSNEAISGKHFDNVTFDDVVFNGPLNGISVGLLLNDTLRKTGPEVMCHVTRFQASVVSMNTWLDDLTVDDGVLGGVNVSELNKEAVRLDTEGLQVLEGQYSFQR